MFEEINKFSVKNKHNLNYIINLPNDYYYNINKTYPVLLFLHGMGECGNNIYSIKKFGIHPYINNIDLPFIIVSPQCHLHNFWDTHLNDIELLLHRINENYRCDMNKLCVVGISMGAFGALNFAMQRPNLFSAIVSICGGTTFPWYAKKIKHIPTYIAHGELDHSVPVAKSVEIAQALQSADGNVTLKIFPNIGHELCTTIFQNEDLYNWIKHNVI